VTIASLRSRVVRSGLALVAIVGIGAVAGQHHRVYDLTDERSLTLTTQSRRVIGGLTDDVEMTAFLRRDEPGRVEAATLLDRYAKESHHIDWRLVDPDDAPGDAARLGVDPVFGGVAVAVGREVEVAPSATEQELTSALSRLQRGRAAILCLTTGHGEVELPAAAALLQRDGFEIETIDLLVRPTIPAQCTAVVLASPAAPLGRAAPALGRWVADDGKLLLLADPAAPESDLTLLLEPLGLSLERGLVFEGDPEAVVAGDVTAPIVRTYSSGHPIVRRMAPTYFPGVQGVEVDDAVAATVPGLTVTRLADSSPAAYLETEPIVASFDPTEDRAGPITVAAAADRSANDGSSISRTRVVVVGDVDFATDAFLGEAGNAALLQRAVGWLTLGQDLAAISPNLPADRPLRLTDARVTYARLLTSGVVPALFLLVGVMVWAARRAR
jgi:hypothetical protein